MPVLVKDASGTNVLIPTLYDVDFATSAKQDITINSLSAINLTLFHILTATQILHDGVTYDQLP